jgi:hexosaminidase
MQIINVKESTKECYDIVSRALDRYKKIITTQPTSSPANSNLKPVQQSNVQQLSVQVEVTDLKNCATEDMDKMDETYTLQMSVEQGNTLSASIKSSTIYGALRGLESLSQRIVASQTGSVSGFGWQFCVNDLPITLHDQPRYGWRGLLIDVSRHYLPIRTLQLILDGMEADKLNVMHLHLVDAQSFPMEIDGSVSKPFNAPMKLTYTAQQLKDLVAYAKDRGIRVVPEIDMPGHAASWDIFGINITANCPSFYGNINNVPLNPANDAVYPVVKKVIDTVKSIFPDRYVHVGADELVKACWRQDPMITEFILNNKLGIQTMDDLWGYFQARMYKDNFEGTNKFINVWEELVLHLNTTQYTFEPQQGIVQVWSSMNYWRSTVSRGYKALLSAPWYLDRLVPVDGSTRWLMLDAWMDMYKFDPLTLAEGIPNAEQLVIGGEACQWGEQVDQAVITTRIWPRVSAVAERLWSEPWVNDTNKAQERLIHHRCYDLVKRNIRASPIRPDFCPYVFSFDDGPSTPNAENGPTRALIVLCVFLSLAVVTLTVALIAVIIYAKKRMASYQAI